MSNTQYFMAGIAAATLVMFAVNITSQEPPKCEASKEAKDALASQESTISKLTKIVDDSNDALKKSADVLAQSCKK